MAPGYCCAPHRLHPRVVTGAFRGTRVADRVQATRCRIEMTLYNADDGAWDVINLCLIKMIYF